jgi:hypothetical protein
VANDKVSRDEFTVKCRNCCWAGINLAEKGERLPTRWSGFLKNGACLRIGGICGKGDGYGGIRKLRRSVVNEELFYAIDSGVEGWSPVRVFGSTFKGVCEGTKNGGCVKKEEQKYKWRRLRKVLKLFRSCGRREIFDCGDMGV